MANAESSTSGSRTPALSPGISSSNGMNSPKDIATPTDSTQMMLDDSSEEDAEMISSTASSKRKMLSDEKEKDDARPAKKAKVTSKAGSENKAKVKAASKEKKAGDADAKPSSSKGKGKANAAHDSNKEKATKKAKADVKEKQLVELKNKKLFFKQSNLALGTFTTTLCMMVELQKFIADLEEPLEEFPQDHFQLLARHIHESDKSLGELAKQIKLAIVPAVSMTDMDTDDKDKKPEILTLKVIKAAINQLATRTNYGIDSYSEIDLAVEADSDADEDAAPSIPVALQIWRWEINDREVFLHDGLAEDIVAKIEARFAERVLVKEKAVEIVAALPEEERRTLVIVKKRVAKEAGDADKPKKSKAKVLTEEELAEKARKDEEKARKDEEKARKGEENARKREEAAAKKEIRKAEAEEKQAKKDAVEKEKKKQASAFTSFFGAAIVEKPASASAASKTASTSQSKAAKSSSPVIVKKVVAVGNHSRNTSMDTDEVEIVVSDFDKTFKGFHAPKGVTVAKVNFLQSRKTKECKLSEVVDSNPALTVEDILAEFAGAPRTTNIPHVTRPRPKYSVKALMKNITEGELTGHAGEDWQQILHDRTKVPVKLFSFQATDRRPGYIGTFSKTSRVIRPRQPFVKDTGIFDYDYDSEADWDDEDPEGEDVNSDDAMSNEGDDDEDDNSLMGDWMCGDDEVDFVDGYVEEDASVPSNPDDLDFEAHQRAAAKREQAARDARRTKKAKPLIPVHIGPCWEDVPGTIKHNTFANLKIQFLNDAQPFLNPLTFVARPILYKKGDNEKMQTDIVSALSNKKESGKEGDAKKPRNSKPFPEHLLQDFVQHVQKSTAANKDNLKTELVARFPSATKASLDILIKQCTLKRLKLSDKVEKQWECADDLVMRGGCASLDAPPSSSSQ